MSGNYDPNLPILREMLALSILNKLEECGFSETSNFCKEGLTHFKERVFSREIPNTGISVNVYTTVVGMEVRAEGKDAIRVCAVYTAKDGTSKGIVKSTRVNRVGNIEDIVERMYKRMRKTWGAAATGDSCYKCGAPKFTAKSGKTVCAEICWLSPEQKAAQKKARGSRDRQWRRNRMW